MFYIAYLSSPFTGHDDDDDYYYNNSKKAEYKSVVLRTY